jgi:DMSO/TMAO reductase YedYZ heme-binding membrane subunit
MTAVLTATVGHGSTAFWYLTRAAGLVSLVLLTATVVLGMVASVGWTTERWPRFLSQSLHRNLSLLCLVFIGIHVVTTVADGYVPIGYLDAVVPFRTAYRPLWVGLGAVALDLLVAVAVTSGLRRRIGASSWRAVHWLAYLCWPVAVLHGMGTGSDTRLSVALGIEVACVAAVVVVGAWRLATGSARSTGWRVGAAVAGLVTVLGMAVFALVGPLRPGWSHRSGTSSALLATLDGGGAAPGGTATAAPGGGLPTASFSDQVSGTSASTSSGGGQEQLTLTMSVPAAPASPLVVQLDGTAVGAGLAMTSSRVTWGDASGTVTSLEGSTIGATVGAAGQTVHLVLDVTLDQGAGTLSGTVSGTPGSGNP